MGSKKRGANAVAPPLASTKPPINANTCAVEGLGPRPRRTEREMNEIPDDIPEDVVRLARKYSMNDDVLVAVCRAILAERERCCSVLRRLHEQQDGETFCSIFIEIEEI